MANHPTPMTEEQLEFFTFQTRHAVSKALRKFAAGAAIGYLILAGGVVAMYENGQSVSDSEQNAIVQSGRAVAVDSCNRDYTSRESYRGLFFRLLAVIDEQVRQGEVTKRQGEFAKRFYRGELAKLPLPDCRKAEKVITDNPDRTTRVPTPLYP
jgi:hypothetical protein